MSDRFDRLCGFAAMAIALAFVLAWCARGGEVQASQAAPPPVQLLNTEVDAVGWALDALLQYPEPQRTYRRFVWLPPYADADWIGAVEFAFNAACSHSRVLVRADRHAQGNLLSFDFEQLVPDPSDRAKVLAVYDGLAVDEHRFHLSRVNVTETDKPVVILAPHLQDAAAKHVSDSSKDKRLDVIVSQLTGSTGAIYPADWLLEQLLTSVRGKYLELQLIGADDSLADVLGKHGFFFEHSRDVSGDKCALLIQSDVTGSSRIVATTYGIASRQPLAVTFDFKDSRVRPDEQFLRNLVEFEPLADAREALVPKPNGLILFLLSDGKGKLQRVAPPNVVCDFTKPDGHTKELEAAMSCIVCHAAQDGYRTARNDLEFLQGADTDFFGHETTYTNVQGKQVTLTAAETLELVAGRFGERIDEPTGILGRARQDYDLAVTRLTGYKRAGLDKPSALQFYGAKIKEIYHGYRFRSIDAERACLELGVKVPAADAIATLRKLVPPQPGQTEDIVIALLRNGAAIKRDDFNAVFVEMARRAADNRSSLVSK